MNSDHGKHGDGFSGRRIEGRPEGSRRVKFLYCFLKNVIFKEITILKWCFLFLHHNTNVVLIIHYFSVFEVFHEGILIDSVWP